MFAALTIAYHLGWEAIADRRRLPTHPSSAARQLAPPHSGMMTAGMIGGGLLSVPSMSSLSSFYLLPTFLAIPRGKVSLTLPVRYCIIVCVLGHGLSRKRIVAEALPEQFMREIAACRADVAQWQSSCFVNSWPSVRI